MAINLTLEELVFAELYDFTLSDGINTRVFFTPYGGTYTSLPVIDGNRYELIPITRSKVSLHTDLQVDTIDISFASQITTIRGRTLVEAVRLGWFDGAEVLIRAINPNLTSQRREIFRGLVGKGIDISRKEIKLKAVSHLDMLRQTLPNLFYTEQCNAQLFDERCGLVKATFRHSGTAGTGSTRIRINNALFNANFTFGEVRMTSGANAGISRTIRLGVAGRADLYRPFDFDVTVGGGFEAWWGCDKAGTTCHTKFANYVNFRGYEYIPNPLTLT